MSVANIRLAAFDMDGTLLSSGSQMREATKEACRALQEKGCKLIISTGRTYLSAHIPIEAFPFDGYVCSNGATIYEKDGTLVSSSTLPGDVVIDIIEKVRQKPMYYEVHDNASNRWMVREDREKMEEMLDHTGAEEDLNLNWRRYSFYKLSKVIEREELYEKIRSGATLPVKMFFWNNHPENLQWVREQASVWEELVEVTSSGRHNVEILVKGVSKWKGVSYFCNKWGIDPSEIAAFGDADNDLDILEHVGVSVAMENGSDEVKRIARYIAKHHDEDGVAQFIRENLL